MITWKGKTKILRHTYEPVQAQRRADHLATEAHRKPTKLTKRRQETQSKKVNSARTRAILESHSIQKRPKVINEQQTFGHWEIAGVMSSQDTQNFVVSFVERKTRFMSKFSAACESITCDRGIEFTSTNFIHSVENTYNKKIYFSDPQAPGQRGTNERLNRELRRIYPVGYNFTKITQKRLQESIRDLNRRPRHILGYQTPEHEFIRRMNENRISHNLAVKFID